jgi:hypothetical protein
MPIGGVDVCGVKVGVGGVKVGVDGVKVGVGGVKVGVGSVKVDVGGRDVVVDGDLEGCGVVDVEGYGDDVELAGVVLFSLSMVRKSAQRPLRYMFNLFLLKCDFLKKRYIWVYFRTG